MKSLFVALLLSQVTVQKDGARIGTAPAINFTGAGVTGCTTGYRSVTCNFAAGGGGAYSGACSAGQYVHTLAGASAPTCSTPPDNDTVPATGACTNQFVRGVNGASAPTCATVALATDTSGTLAVGRGGTNLTASAEDNVMIGNGTTWETKPLPSCSNGTTDKLLYNSSTNAFSCGTDQTGGGGGTTVKRVSVDQSSTVTSFADVTDLTFTIGATGTYAIHCNITYTSAATTTAIQMALNGPTASDIDYYVFTNTTATAKHDAVQTAYDTVTNPATGGGAVRLGVRVDGTVVLTATGTLAVRFRSEVAASAVTVKRGSWCALDVIP